MERASVWGNYGDHPRLVPCKTCKKRRKTPATPSDFYLVYGLSHSGEGVRVGPFDDDFPPYHNAVKNEQEAAMNELVKNPVISDADLEGSGVESAQSPHRPANTRWPITANDWRGTVEPNRTALLYLDACKKDFCLGAIATATTSGGRLVYEYGSFPLAPRDVQAHMVRKKDYLRRTASKATFNGPELTQRLIDIHTFGPIPLFRGPTPQGLRCRGFPYGQSATEYILSKLWKDSGAGRLMMASARTISETDKIIWRPTTTLRKSLPDRRWPDERRAIWDGGRANLFMRKSGYHPPCSPYSKRHRRTQNCVKASLTMYPRQMYEKGHQFCISPNTPSPGRMRPFFNIIWRFTHRVTF